MRYASKGTLCETCNRERLIENAPDRKLCVAYNRDTSFGTLQREHSVMHTVCNAWRRQSIGTAFQRSALRVTLQRESYVSLTIGNVCEAYNREHFIGNAPEGTFC